MSRQLLTVLAALLALQLVLAAVLYWPRDDGDGAGAGPLVPAALADRVDRLRIGDGDGDSTELLRDDGGWRLAGSDLPVAPGRASELLSALESTPGWPVARSTSARERFRVAAETFERRIDLLGDGETLATVYLGTAPGFRKVHARAADGDAIYSIAFNAYDAPAEANGWLDRALAAVTAPTGIAWDGGAIERAGDGWAATAGEAVDTGSAPGLVQALETLQVTGTAPPALAERAAQAEPEATLRVSTGEDAEQELRLAQADDERLLYAGAWGRWFTVSRYDYDRLVDALAALSPGEEAAAGDSATEP